MKFNSYQQGFLVLGYLYGDLCYESNFVRILPSQQSADWCQLLPEDEKSILQLSFPQVRSPRQSESLSQSPPPTSQGCLLLQQFQFVYGTPLHRAGAGVVGAGTDLRKCLIDFFDNK